jgi:hypothetical protein
VRSTRETLATALHVSDSGHCWRKLEYCGAGFIAATSPRRRSISTAITAYVWFQQYGGTCLASESQVDFSLDLQQSAVLYPPNGRIFEVEDHSFDIEQTLNLG